MQFKIISRQDAMFEGSKRFYTGTPCKYGHDSQRFVTTGGCVKCNAVRSNNFSNGVRVVMNAAASGNFIYALHPDDHAAALAYCQALDLGRGRMPKVPTLTPAGLRQVETPVEIIPDSVGFVPRPDRFPPTDPAAEAKRQKLFADLAASRNSLPYLPKP